ncbi:PP2C family protein-serine/threonine phosphatase [Hamadaea tsunoensis]|uniref:PP2C family protein-serine/threonine phosphatase n=1 Tax=Hamadaea tsunoensis TaxID=53368 RepID=UPI0006891A97|nr:GAF domain-containing SpoIIE family protein phosphatase [Hamadaea tsunoensis]
MAAAVTATRTAAAQLRRIQAVTDAALSSLDLDAMLAELLDRTREVLDADTAAIMLLDPSGTELVATAAAGLEDEVRLGIRVPVGEGFTGRIAATARPMILDHVDPGNVFSPVLLDQHLISMAGVPMLDQDEVIGVLYVGRRRQGTFTGEDVEVLRLVADRASLATRAQLRRLDRAATLALQRSLLPARPAPLPGLDLAARYLPGQQVGVGGDWYDAFRLPSGHTGLVIGDVAGSGLAAAVIMGRIRSALRAYALEDDDPAEVLARLDRKIQLFEPGALATAAYVVIPPAGDVMHLSLAGHLPPVYAGPGAPARPVDTRPDLPLGVFPDAPRRTYTLPFPTGATLLLYTDGLVERRDRVIDDGIAELARTVAGSSALEICNAAVGLAGDQAVSDDIAILAVLRTGSLLG